MSSIRTSSKTSPSIRQTTVEQNMSSTSDRDVDAPATNGAKKVGYNIDCTGRVQVLLRKDQPRVEEGSVLEYDEEALSWGNLTQEENRAEAVKECFSYKDACQDGFKNDQKDDNMVVATAVRRDTESGIEIAIPSSFQTDHVGINGNKYMYDDTKYPKDTYSILALNGPSEDCWPIHKMLFCLFGLVPFLFQMGFLQLLIFHLDSKTFAEDAEDPHVEYDENCIRQVRVAQALSLLAYVMFPTSTLQDVVKAIRLFPTRKNNCIPVGCLRLACFLRALQGIFATSVIFLLVVSSHNTLDIILNFTAVNFITDLDDTAFSLAMVGVFGPRLRDETNRIANANLPASIYRKSTHIWYGAVMLCTALILFGMMTFVMLSEQRAYHWIIESLKAQKIVISSFIALYIAYLAIKGTFVKCRRNS
jgi:hypothetical protein